MIPSKIGCRSLENCLLLACQIDRASVFSLEKEMTVTNFVRESKKESRGLVQMLKMSFVFLR